MQRAVIDGKAETGITTMYMAEGLDTGDMILKEEVQIPDDMTGAQLHDALSACGARLIVQTLAALADGTAVRTPQEGDTSYAKMITKEELKLEKAKIAKICRAIDFDGLFN